MYKSDTFKEITPLSAEDCFLVTQRVKPGFNQPLHVHKEYELNYLENANGVLRMVGDSMEELDDLDLVLIAGDTKHTYANHKCSRNDTMEITIQFSRSLFDSLVDKRHFKSIKKMFENAVNGLAFSREMVRRIQPDLKSLSNDEQPDSFNNLLRLIDMLKTLSLDKQARCLNTDRMPPNTMSIHSDRLDSIMLFLHENYQYPIALAEVASLISMSEASLTRFLKRWTGKTFIDILTDIRISEALCRLVDTSDSISEICYKCGFNNLSNFNRTFRKRKGCTPTEYREKYSRSRFRI